ncbi:MAG: protein translocase subunit SecD [Aestuariibacter sp.]
MKVFSYRALAYVLIVVLGLLSAVPNILPQSMQQQLPDWYTQSTLSLGLDLQGGSHLLLEADATELNQRHLDDFFETYLTELRAYNIRYSRVKSAAKEQQAVSLKSSQQISDALKLANRLTIKHARQTDGTLSIAIQQLGSKLVFSLTDEYKSMLLKDAIERSLEVVRKRLDETGLTEPSITRQGQDAILVQMPGVSDPQQIKSLLGTTAQMNFHWHMTQDSSKKSFVLHDRQGNPLLLEQEIALEGAHIVDATAAFSQQTGQPIVTFKFDAQGASKFAEMTKHNIGRVLAVVLDNEVVTAPVIRSIIPGGRGEISGNFSVKETQDVALMLRTGALPIPLNIIEERSVGPDLGSDAIDMGIYTGVLGAVLVLVFMVSLYGRWGLIACAGLTINMGLVFGLLSVFGATLTLPGIAGLILTIGMAVDANILINERIREESHQGRPGGSAINVGFDKAFATIIDSNLTTLIAVSLLFMFGSGPIKGFAITIAIGLVTSMFTSFALTRRFMLWAVRSRAREKLRFGGAKIAAFSQNKAFNFLRFGKRTVTASLLLTTISIGLFLNPGLHYGVDFTGGTLIEVVAPEMDVENLRDALQPLSHANITIQEYGNAHHFLLQAPMTDEGAESMMLLDGIKATIVDHSPEANFLKVDAVGPKVSGEFADLSILALLIASTGMLVYLWIRFEQHFALAAIVTIVLDLAKTIGFFALLGLEFNLTAIAALLALIGYSINDKVVVFDRVRELFRLQPEAPIADVMNRAISSTLTRTLFTSVTTLLALLPMAVAGGDAVTSFALPMIFAVVMGTSSTIFIASPILAALAKRRAAQGKSQLRPTAEEIQQELAHMP